MNKTQVSGFLKKYTMVIALILVFALFYILTGGKILYAQNLNNLISQNAYVFVLAIGMLMCILTGGNIDLSVGSVVCFAGGIGAVIMDKDLPWVVAVLAMLIVGLLVGIWQGFWVAKIKVPPFIATLAGMYAFRGLSNVVLGGMTVTIDNKTFLNVFGGGADCYVPDFIPHGDLPLGIKNLTCLIAGIVVAIIYIIVELRKFADSKKRGYATKLETGKIIQMAVISIATVWFSFMLSKYKGIPSSVLWMLFIVFVYGYITTKTRTGRYFYAVGGNEKATRLSGINTNKVYFLAYANMGLLAGLAGIMTVARATQAQPTFGQAYEMDAIGACFIGGASAYGGVGTVPGVIIGALLMGVINQGMSIMGMDANYQKVIKGLVLLAAVIFDVLSKKEKK